MILRGLLRQLTASRVKFPAVQIASGNANSLDDYEEGTFTPVVYGTTGAGNGTYTTQAGIYTKIGRVVYFTAYCVWTAHDGTGNLRISGLPFTSTASVITALSVWMNNLAITSNYQLIAYVSSNSTIIIFDMYNGTTRTSLPIDSAASILVTGQYFVD